MPVGAARLHGRALERDVKARYGRFVKLSHCTIGEDCALVLGLTEKEDLMRKTTGIWVILCAALAMSAIGCDDKEKAQAAADQLKREAEEKIATEKRAAEEKIAAAKKELEEKAQKAAAEGRAAVKKEIDGADRKITYLKEKAAKLTGAAKKNADAALAEVDKRREGVRADFAKLETAGAGDWNALKTAATTNIEQLTKAVEALEAVVTKK
jgi:hypothetical protein